MERVGSIRQRQTEWGSATAGGPLGVVLLVVSLVVGGTLVGWAAYVGQAEFALALMVAGMAFFFVVSRPEIGIVLLLSTMLLTYPDILEGRGLLTINNLLGVMFVVLLLARAFFGEPLWFLREKEVRLFLLLGGVLVVATLLGEYILPKLRYAIVVEDGKIAKDLTAGRLKDFFSRLAFFIFFINFITTRRHLTYVLLLLLGCILLTVPAALYVYASGTGIELVDAEQRVTAGFFLGGGSGWLSNPNRFAFMYLLGIALLFYLAMGTPWRSLRIAVVPVAVILTILVLLTGSRSGLIGFFLMLGWFLFTRRTSAQAGLRLGLGLLGVSAVVTFLLLAPPVVQERLLNLNPFAPEGEGTHSTEVRTTTVAQGLSIFFRYPILGVGVGNFRWVNAYYYGNNRPTHNSYLWALATGGIVLFTVYMVLFSAVFARLRLLRDQVDTDPFLAALRDWLVLYFTLFLFFSFFADVWLEEVHLYLITGIGIVLHRLVTTAGEHEQHPHRVLY